MNDQRAGNPRGGKAMDRREFLRSASVAAAFGSGPVPLALARSDQSPTSGKLRVAAVVTEFTYRSHAHVILENFLEPYLFNGRKTEPGTEIAALYIDQFPRNDMGRSVAKEYKVPIYPTIAEALCAG